MPAKRRRGAAAKAAPPAPVPLPDGDAPAPPVDSRLNVDHLAEMDKYYEAIFASPRFRGLQDADPDAATQAPRATNLQESLHQVIAFDSVSHTSTCSDIMHHSWHTINTSIMVW
eukprot:3534429-Alexandrium_andersonii.AAC.1